MYQSAVITHGRAGSPPGTQWKTRGWKQIYRQHISGPGGPVERLQKDLAEHGTNAGVCRIRRIRKKLGIKCKQKKKFKATTDSDHTLPVAENLLKQQFKADAPNQVWVTEITYVPTDEGWLYLAGYKDICSVK